MGARCVLVGDGELGERAIGEAEDGVAGPEPGHVGADRLDGASDVAADDRLLRLPDTEAGEAEQVGHAGHQVPDVAADTGGCDPDEDLVVPDVRNGQFLELQLVGAAVAVAGDRLHVVLLGRWCGSTTTIPPACCADAGDRWSPG